MATKATPNPTKADIVRLLVVQAHADAEKRLRDFEQSRNANATAAVAGSANGASEPLGRLRGEVRALAQLKDKVVAYLDRGDISVLIR
jgi:cell fate (sporulation/competence/biofilm development) regulator YlbF (YheA/YmcA/DUF963 family)